MADCLGSVQAPRASVHPADGIAIGVIAYGVTAGVNTSLEVADHVLVFFFVLTWLAAAARRVTDFRHGRCPAYRVHSTNIFPVIGLLVVGTAPWFAMSYLRGVLPDSRLWTPIQLPMSAAGLGVVLAIVTLGLPLVGRASSERRGPAFGGVSVESMALSAALFLLSGSLVIGTLAALWLAFALRRVIVRTTTASGTPDIAIDAAPALTGETSAI